MGFRSKIIGIFLLILPGLVMVPATAGVALISVKDDTGFSVKMARPPRRIVSLAPNMTEILYGLGLGDRVVGVTDSCDYPPEAKEKPKVGGKQIDNERILMLRPDLVVAHAGLQRQTIDRLRRMGLPVIALDPKDWHSLLRTMEKLGVVTGTKAQAEHLVREMEARRQRVAATVAGNRRVRVFVEVWNKPLMTAGPGTFLDEMVSMAGGANIAADVTTPWSVYPEEKVLLRDPEVIILTCKNKQEVLQRRAWQRITAVRGGWVYEVNPDIYSRPGPRLVEALEDLVSLLASARGEDHH